MRIATELVDEVQSGVGEVFASWRNVKSAHLWPLVVVSMPWHCLHGMHCCYGCNVVPVLIYAEVPSALERLCD